MFGSDFWNSVTFADLMALSGVVAMIVGGATLFASGIPTRSDALEHRIKIALPRAGVKQAEAAPGARPLAILLKLPSLGGGLTEAEHRQVIRTYTSLGVIADRAVPFFILSRLVLAASFGVVILLAGLHSGVAALHGWVLMLAAIGSAIAGWLLPIFVISHLLKRRTKAIAAGLPNALELLVVCVEAGLSLEDGLQRVARELQESQPALAEELALTWAEVNILPDRTQALINLADRVRQSEHADGHWYAVAEHAFRNAARTIAADGRNRDAQRPTDTIGRAREPFARAYDHPCNVVYYADDLFDHRWPGSASVDRHVRWNSLTNLQIDQVI